MVRWLLKDLQIVINTPTNFFCDRQAAHHILNNIVFHEKTKHVEMECFFVRERVASLEVSLMKIDDKMQVVDFLTKDIGFNQLHYLLGNMGISNLHSPS